MADDNAPRRQWVGDIEYFDRPPERAVLTVVERTILEVADTWDPGSIAIGGMAGTDVAVVGVALGDFAMASLSVDPQDLVVSAQVDAADNVRVTLSNNTAGAIDLASHTVRVRVIKATA